MTADEALTEIQRIVTRAVAKGDNSSYIDEISELITDELMENPEKLFIPASKFDPDKIIIHTKREPSGATSVNMTMPLDAALEVSESLTDTGMNPAVAEKLKEAVRAVTITASSTEYISWIERA
jgi:hypothetical protein